jgi:ABC-type antimicrobial peptide transport system permease subunit
MRRIDAWALGWSNLGRRKGRTALTAAGIVVGVAALVLMISLGIGVQRQVLGLIETEHTLRTLRVTRVKADGAKPPGPGLGLLGIGGQMLPVTDRDLAEMEKIPGVALALPVLNLFPRVVLEAAGRKRSLEVYPVAGVHPAEEAWARGLVLHGRLWASPDEKACLLPLSLVQAVEGLDPAAAPGGRISISGLLGEEEEDEPETFAVAGVYDSARLGLRGDQILVPLASARELRDRLKIGFSIFAYKKGAYFAAEVRVDDPRRVERVAARLRDSGYTVVSTADVIRSVNLIFLVVEAFMGCIGMIGLVVSLFGIANTLATAVLERTREIGIMKALGGRNRDIGRLFLAEAAALGLLGGILGLGLGWGAGALLGAVARRALELPGSVRLFHVPLWLAAGSVAFSMFVSVAAGWIPARRAARMEPVAALRHE